MQAGKTVAPPEERESRRLPLRYALLYPLLLLLLALQHLRLFFSRTEIAHFDHLVWSFIQLDRGNPWELSPELWQTSLRLGGPLYYWLNLPGRLFTHPVLGFHLYYFLLELGAITFWLFWGLRQKMDRGLVWAGALCLVLFTDSKLVVCENMTIAVYISIPLFITFLTALSRPRWTAMLLPGLLLGLIVQVHLTSLFFVPALLLMLLTQRNLFWKRLPALLVGWPVVLLLSLPGLPPLGEIPLGGVTSSLLQDFHVGAFFYRLRSSFGDPLCLLGIGLVVVARFKNKPVKVGERFSVLWLLTGYVLLSAALSYLMVPQFESRYALLNPARALLGAVGLIWLHGLVAPLLGRTRLGEPSRAASLMVAGLFIAALLGWSAYKNWSVFEEQFRAEKSEHCDCRYWCKDTSSRYYYKYFDALIQGGLPPVKEERVYINGPMKERTETAVYWIRSGQSGRGARGGEPPSANNMILAPRIRGFDLGAIEGARDYGDFYLIPGVVPFRVRPDPRQREFSLEINGTGRREALVMLTVLGEEGFVAPRSVEIQQRGEKVKHFAVCQCETGQGMGSRYAGWLLFRVRLEPEGLSRMKAVIHYDRGRMEQVHAVLLPPVKEDE